MALAVLNKDGRQTQVQAVKIELNLREVKWIETQLERVSGEMRLDLIATLTSTVSSSQIEMP